ncbi:MAG: sugar phosphate isomerase/epimerase family protein [Thermoguttaceae bacterium]
MAARTPQPFSTQCGDFSRRDFLSRVGGASLGLWAIAQGIRPSQADDAPAGWPVWVGCRDAMLTPMKRKDSWEALKAIGAECVTVWTGRKQLEIPFLIGSGKPYTLASSDIARLGDDARAAGVRITAFCMGNRFDVQPDVEIQHCGMVARAADQLGAPAIRIDVAPRKMERNAFRKQAVKALKKILADTESTGVKFAIENHGNTTNDPDFMQSLFDRVGSERLGLTLDTANLYWFGHPLSKVYSLFERFAPRVYHTHCKSIRYPETERERLRPMGWKYAEYQSSIDQGDIDFTRVASILRKAGYHNDLCVEDEFLDALTPEAATDRLARQIALLKKVRANVSKP